MNHFKHFKHFKLFKLFKLFKKFILVPVLPLGTITLLLCFLMISACSTSLTAPFDNPFSIASSEKITAQEHQAKAKQYLAMAGNAGSNVFSNEYKLRAADHFLKASQIQPAREIIRELQNSEDPTLDMQTRSLLLEARLALNQNDSHRAEVHLGMLLAPFAQNPHLIEVIDPETGKPRSHGYSEGDVLRQAKAQFNGQKIALLLPSQGPHAKAAKTIRDGFLAAYYKTMQQGHEAAKVQVYDTGQGDQVEAAYRKAIEEKSDFIVGPLTKAEVQAIAGIKLDTPVLALNSIQNVGSLNKKSGKLFQFGLMPEDEIASTVNNARKRGHKKALIIMPSNEWGQRMASTFQELWSYQGGKIAGTLQLNAKEDLVAQLQAHFEKGSQNQAQKPNSSGVQRGSGTQKNQNPASIQKADMIFLAASPELARQIKPLLMHYQTQPLPIYATSSVYSGHPSPKYDQDLDGIHFCDMPWVIQKSNESQENRNFLADLFSNPMGFYQDQGFSEQNNHLSQNQNQHQHQNQSQNQKQNQNSVQYQNQNNSTNPRYFALGMDAYQIASQLSHTGFPLSGTPGMTGHLHKDGQRIQRSLVCVTFEKGVPVPD